MQLQPTSSVSWTLVPQAAEDDVNIQQQEHGEMFWWDCSMSTPQLVVARRALDWSGHEWSCWWQHRLKLVDHVDHLHVIRSSFSTSVDRLVRGNDECVLIFLQLSLVYSPRILVRRNGLLDSTNEAVKNCSSLTHTEQTSFWDEWSTTAWYLLFLLRLGVVWQAVWRNCPS